MKKLNIFLHFDFAAFSKGKRFLSVDQKPWADFKSGEVLGTKYELVIIEDKTDYGVAGDATVNNLYEKFIVKVPKDKLSDIPMNAEVRLVNPRANVYGDFRNQLSVTADGLAVIK